MKRYETGRLSRLSKSSLQLDNLSTATKQAGCPRLSRLSNIFITSLDANHGEDAEKVVGREPPQAVCRGYRPMMVTNGVSRGGEQFMKRGE